MDRRFPVVEGIVCPHLPEITDVVEREYKGMSHRFLIHIDLKLRVKEEYRCIIGDLETTLECSAGENLYFN